MATPKDHIEYIRKTKFSLDNPLAEDLHQAVKHLSAELYSKDVHFLMELIQNAEDNTYAPQVQPSLEFIITSKDICEVDATATLLVFNNEIGFQKHNIDSICSVGRSTKKRREGGYIGEKGIGFKSVFVITSQPCIFSNGYHIRFSDVPLSNAKIGYIVPEWIESRPSIAQLEEIYERQLPNTVIVLPLRPEKVEAVKKELSSIQPEVILFMSKIKKLSVRELHVDARLNKTNEINVSRETNLRSSNSKDIESFTLHLSGEENKRSIGKSSYYMWRQRFPVKNEYKVEQRKDLEKWAITLAFPFDKRLTRGNVAAPGIYAFLPTEMVTGFPFFIQADFLLVSSRESIIFDNKWNQGILQCIPLAFGSAFRFFVHADSLPSSKSHFYKYIPVDPPGYQQLEQVRQGIRAELRMKEIILCDSSFVENDFGRPKETWTILPAFRSILQRARQESRQSGLDSFLASEVKIVHPCLDNPEFSNILKFLHVVDVSSDWYAGCIQSSGWLEGLPENLYVELLCFIAEYWNGGLSTHLQVTPFLKFVNNSAGNAALNNSASNTAFACVLNDKARTSSKANDEARIRIYFSSEQSHITWLTEWSGELQSAAQHYFMPGSTQKAIMDLDGNKGEKLRNWLEQYPKITQLCVSSFAKQLQEVVTASTNSKLVINATHFFHYSSVNGYIHKKDLQDLCSNIPIVDERGIVKHRCAFVNGLLPSSISNLLPASISNWPMLMKNYHWNDSRIQLSEDYLTVPPCAEGLRGAGKELVSFLQQQLGASDIPQLVPPSAYINFGPLAKEDAFLLLEWIRYHNNLFRLHPFRRNVSLGKWLKTSRGFESPATSFLFDFNWNSASQLEENDCPFIDQAFYGNGIYEFKDALKLVEVVTEGGQGCDVIVDHHIHMHKDFEAITRLYRYLQASNWKPHGSKVLPIWIPDKEKWMSTKYCVIHDVDGLFESRLNVLEGWYDEELLKFFSNSLGVPSHPQIDDYCLLWRDRAGNENHGITETECCLVWKHIVQNWSSSSFLIKQCLGSGCKVPVCTTNGDIRVSSPGQAYVPDDLQLKELFQGGSSMVNFTWHPNPSDPQIPLDTLFSIYNNLGLRNISQVVKKTEISMPQMVSLQKLQPGEGTLRIGLYKIVIACLAKPSIKVSADKRHQLVRTLINCPVYGVAEPLSMEYSLLLAHNIIRVKTKSMVRWEKIPKRLLVQTVDRDNRKAKMLFVTEFAEVISQGLLAEFPDLVGELCEMIKLGHAFDFDPEAVDVMLRNRNLQLFIEDKRFLSSYFSRLSSVTKPV